MKNRWALHFADVAAPRIGKDEREQGSSMTATLSPVLKIASMAAVIAPRISVPSPQPPSPSSSEQKMDILERSATNVNIKHVVNNGPVKYLQPYVPDMSADNSGRKLLSSCPPCHSIV